MAKILALDVGQRRIGYAVGELEHRIAFPRETLAKNPHAKLFVKLREILKEEQIGKIIIGLPLNEDNKDTEEAFKIKQFGNLLAREFLLPIEYIDEFGSSHEAMGKIPFRRDRAVKGNCDPLAAQIILQRYFDGL